MWTNSGYSVQWYNVEKSDFCIFVIFSIFFRNFVIYGDFFTYLLKTKIQNAQNMNKILKAYNGLFQKLFLFSYTNINEEWEFKILFYFIIPVCLTSKESSFNLIAQYSKFAPCFNKVIQISYRKYWKFFIWILEFIHISQRFFDIHKRNPALILNLI